jgi:hypothetical protein
MTNVDKAYRVTGWTLVRDVDGAAELKGNEQHAETVKGPHKVFIDGKTLPDVDDSDDTDVDIDEEVVIDALRMEEVINQSRNPQSGSGWRLTARTVIQD